jgi:hypothetical protein
LVSLFYRPPRPLGRVKYNSTLFLDLCTRMGRRVSITPRPLSIPRNDPVPIVQYPVWAPGPKWTGAENFASTGFRSTGRPARSQSLYRLSYPLHRKVCLLLKYPLALFLGHCSTAILSLITPLNVENSITLRHSFATAINPLLYFVFEKTNLVRKIKLKLPQK